MIISISLIISMTSLACDEDPPPSPQGESEGESSSDMGGVILLDDVDSAIDLGVDQGELDAELPRVTPPQRIERITIGLSAGESPAGDIVTARCVALDAEGIEVEDVSFIQRVTPAAGWATGEREGEYIGERAGYYELRCVTSEPSLISDPALWHVLPGPLTRTVATASEARVSAGTETSISCTGFDAFSNSVTVSDFTLSANVMSDLVTFDAGLFSATLAGEYLVSCLSGGAEAIAAPITVTPAAAERLRISVEPARPVYEVGALIRRQSLVTDRFGNEVRDATVSWITEPELNRFGVDRYELSVEGVTRLTATLTLDDESPADENPDDLPQPLVETISLEVDSTGPQVSCDQPLDGSMIIWREELTLGGTVSDSFEVNQVLVDEVETQLGAEGRFETIVTPQLGLNWHQVSATDRFGNTAEVLCVYFAAYDYLPDDQPLSPAITVLLEQPSVDEGEPATPIQSLADLFRGVVDSDEIATQINEAALSENPILPNTCIQDSFFGCVLRAEGRLRNVQILGSRPISLDVSDEYDGSLGLDVRLNQVRLNLNLSGRAFGISYNTDGYMETSFISVGAHFAIDASQGSPDVRVIPESQVVGIGAFSSDFSGVSGAIIDFALPYFEDSLRGTVQSSLSDSVFELLDGLLSESLGALNLADLGFDFDLEGLSGQPVSVSLATALSQMSVDATGLKIELSTLAVGQVEEAMETPGIPRLAAPTETTLGSGRGIAMEIQLSMINQLLYALWRGGFFVITGESTDIDNPDNPDNPEDVNDESAPSTQLRLLSPPVLGWAGEGNTIRIHFGPALVTLDYPQIFSTPLSMRVVSTLITEAGIDAEGGLSFGVDGLNFEQLELEVRELSMSPAERRAVRDELGALIIALAGAGIGEALPSVPIPAFAIPPELGGVPDLEIGLRNHILSIDAERLTLDGEFGQ